MSNGENGKTNISRAAVSEAAAWVARLHGPGRNAGVEEGFRQWLKESEEHARAFELVTDSWDEVASLKGAADFTISVPSSETGSSGPPRSWRVLLATAAVLLVLAAGGLAYYHQFFSGVSTEVGEQRMLTLKDGTRVYLNTSTHIVVQFNNKTRHVRLESGEALFEVSKHSDWPFVVTAGDREVTALGTAFLVRRDNGHVAVTLMEGKVAVTPREKSPSTDVRSQREAILVPGERLTISTLGQELRDRPSLIKLTAWQHGKVAIDNMTLTDAITEMNRYSVVQLSAEGLDTGELFVSGVFRAGDSESFARAVADTYGLTIRQKYSRIVLTSAMSN